MIASREGHLQVVRALLDNGADIHAKENNGKLVNIFLLRIVMICHIIY